MQLHSNLAAPVRPSTPRAGDPYRSTRAKAWRNAMVSAVNAGLEHGLFGVRPGENLWPGYRAAADADHARPRGATYRFVFGGNVPAIAWVGDAGFDELSVHVALWPTPEAERWIVCHNASRLAGELFGSGWLERRIAPYLQETPNLITGRRERIAAVAVAEVEPLRSTYRDRGRMIL